MYTVTKKDMTPEGLKNLLDNYEMKATFSGGPIKSKSGKLYNINNYMVDGMTTVEALEDLIDSDVYGKPMGIYLSARHGKGAVSGDYNIFTPIEMESFRGLPLDAVNLIKEQCFAIRDEYKNSDGLEDSTSPGTGEETNKPTYPELYSQLNDMEIGELKEMCKKDNVTFAPNAKKENLVKKYIKEVYKLEE